MAPSDVDNPSGLTFDKYGRILIGNIMSYSNTVYTKTSDAAERYPTQINEIWNNYAAIPFTCPPALAANQGPGGGVVELVHMRLQRVGQQTATRLLYEQDPADLAPPANPNSANSGLSAVVPAWTGDPSGASGQYAPKLTTTILVPVLPPSKDGEGSSASRPLGSAPGPNTQTTSVKVTIPYDSHTWVVDGTSHLLEFPRDAPPVVKAGDWWVNLDSYNAVLYLDFYRYTGATGGNGAPTGGGTVIGGQSLGTVGTSPIFNQNAGGVLTFNALKGSSGIQVSAPDANGDITVSSAVAPVDIAGTAAGGVQLWATPNVGGNIPFRQLRAGAGVTLDTTSFPGSITIIAAGGGGGGGVLPVSTGGGTPVYNGVSVAGAPQIRSLLPGAGITVAPSSGLDAVQVSSSVSAVRMPGASALSTTRRQIWLATDPSGNIPLLDLELGPGLSFGTSAGALFINMDNPTSVPGGISLTSLNSIGGTGTTPPTSFADIYSGMAGTVANIRSIVSGSGINVSVVNSSGALADRIMISSTVAPTSATGIPAIVPVGPGNTYQTALLYAPTPANTVTLYSIAAGPGMSLTATSNGQIVLNAAVIGASLMAIPNTDASPAGAPHSIYRSNASGVLQFAQLVAGSNVTITPSTSGAYFTIAATGGGGGATSAADSSIIQTAFGTNSYRLWNNPSAGTIGIQAIQAGSNITISPSSGILTIASQAGGSGTAVPVVTSPPTTPPDIATAGAVQTVPLTGSSGVAGETAIYSLTTAGGVTLATGALPGSIYISATTTPAAATTMPAGNAGDGYAIYGTVTTPVAGQIYLNTLKAGTGMLIGATAGLLTLNNNMTLTNKSANTASTEGLVGQVFNLITQTSAGEDMQSIPIQAGAGISFTTTGNSVIITATGGGGGGVTTVAQDASSTATATTGTTYRLWDNAIAAGVIDLYSIAAGTNMSVSTSTVGVITLNAATTVPIAATTTPAGNAGAGYAIYGTVTTPVAGQIYLNTLKAGTGMLIGATAGLLTLNNNMTLTNKSANTASTEGLVGQVFNLITQTSAGEDMQSIPIQAGAGISFTTTGNSVIITATGGGGATTVPADATETVAGSGPFTIYGTVAAPAAGTMYFNKIQAGTGLSVDNTTAGILNLQNTMAVTTPVIDAGVDGTSNQIVNLLTQSGGAGTAITSIPIRAGTGITLSKSVFTNTLTINATVSPFEYRTDAGTKRIITCAVPADTAYNGAHYLFGVPNVATNLESSATAIVPKLVYRSDKGAFRVGADGKIPAYNAYLNSIINGSQWNESNIGYYSIAGGYGNVAAGLASTCFGIGNYVYNNAIAPSDTIDIVQISGGIGGATYKPSGGSSILGGTRNYINYDPTQSVPSLCQASVIVTGQLNSIQANAVNSAASSYNFIGCGLQNYMDFSTSQNIVNEMSFNTILNGYINHVSGNARGCAIITGEDNRIEGATNANVSYSAILAGTINKIQQCSNGAILAGQNNTLGSTGFFSNSAIIAGGGHTINADNAAIIAGSGSTVNGEGCVIITGTNSTIASTNTYCTITNGINVAIANNNPSAFSTVSSSTDISLDGASYCTVMSAGKVGSASFIKNASGCVIMACYDITPNNITGDGITNHITNNVMMASSNCSIADNGLNTSVARNTYIGSTLVTVGSVTGGVAGTITENTLLSCGSSFLKTDILTTLAKNVVMGTGHNLSTASGNNPATITNVFNNVISGNSCTLVAAATNGGGTNDVDHRGIFDNFIFGGSNGMTLANTVVTPYYGASNSFLVSVTDTVLGTGIKPDMTTLFGGAGNAPNNCAVFCVGSGGFRIHSNNSTAVYAKWTGGAWNTACDRNVKENFVNIDGLDALNRLDDVTIYRYNYIGIDPSNTIIGPVAQEWNLQFGDDKDALTIKPADLEGVALASIKGLHAKVKAQAATIEGLLARLAALEARVA